jgi:hypothetical protein
MILFIAGLQILQTKQVTFDNQIQVHDFVTFAYN